MSYKAGKYMFKVYYRSNSAKCKIAKLIIKTPERPQCRRSDAFSVNFEHISNLALVFLLLTLRR